jgi:RsiW-degrading membrane proteinase PrsW (M82 family)
MNLFLLAIVPVIIVVGYIYFKDTFEKEPIKLVFINFLLGASVSVFLTLSLSLLGSEIVVSLDEKNLFQIFFHAFITIALVEEFSKYIIVRFYAQKNKEFNEPFDGIVYAVMVSMGFTAVENVFYVFQYGAETGITRAFTAVPAHATFGILMGYFMGKAKFSKNRIVLNLSGLFIAIVFHGAYNFFLFLNFIPGLAIGALLSLILGIILSRKAIKIHQKNSKFNL